MGRPALAGVLDLGVDELRELAAGVVGRDHQVLEGGAPVVALEKAEDPAHFAGDALVGCEQAVVRVDPGGGLVEVAGADVGVQHGLSVRDPGYEDQLGVHLETRHAVDDSDPLFLEAFRPVHVVGLVEPGLQLHDHGHPFAVAAGVDQGIDDLRVPRHPVQRHLDGTHLGVDGGLPQELDKVVEGLVRIVDQDVASPDGLEEGGRGVEVHMGQRRQRRRRELLRTDAREAHEVLEVVVPSAGDERAGLGIEAHLALQQLEQPPGDLVVVDETDRRPGPSLLEALGNLLDVALVKVVVEVEPRVPRDFDGVRLELVEGEDGEDVLQAIADHVVQQDHVLPVPRLGQDHETRQHVGGYLDQRVLGPAGLAAVEGDGQIDRLILQLRELSQMIDHQGDQGGPQLLLIELLDVGFLGGVELALPDDGDAVLLKLLEDVPIRAFEQRLLLQHDGVYLFQDRGRVLAHQAPRAGAELFETPEMGHTDAKELVEIGREDAEEAEPFQQRHRRIRGLLEDAAVERQPTDLLVPQRRTGLVLTGCHGKEAEETTTIASPLQYRNRTRTECAAGRGGRRGGFRTRPCSFRHRTVDGDGQGAASEWYRRS